MKKKTKRPHTSPFNKALAITSPTAKKRRRPLRADFYSLQPVDRAATEPLATENHNGTSLPNLETLQQSLLFLMSKFALTQENTYAEAAYQHLHLLATRCGTDTQARVVYRSLAMDWLQVCRGRMPGDEQVKNGPH